MAGQPRSEIIIGVTEWGRAAARKAISAREQEAEGGGLAAQLSFWRGIG
jgi:hypothetical protein